MRHLRVLLVEDDATLGAAVRDHVMHGNHAVDWMQHLEDAKVSMRVTNYDLVLLDIRLPDGNGVDFLTDLRTSGDATPVIILTAHDQISERIRGLNAGADDYLVKPFDLDELTARMHAVARRHSGRPDEVIRLGSLHIHIADRRVTSANQEITLSGREWAVLERLLARIGAIVSKAQIEETLYAFGWEIESNTVEVYISRLRKKLGRQYVATVRGVGYRIEGRT